MDNKNGTAATVVATKVDKPIEAITSKIGSGTAAITDTTTTVESIKSADNKLDVKLAPENPAAKPDELKALNSSNDATGNKTTTTVTVNVTQTKVVLDEVDKGQSIGEVVSTVSSIAEAAVSAIEKPSSQQSEQQLQSKASSVSGIEMADDDVEMLEPDTDCEMKDVSVNEEQPQVVTTTTAAIGNSNAKSNAAATVAATATVDSTNTNVNSQNNEAEQKIDDVEKNISNLFNGDDNVGSTNDKSIANLSASDNLKATGINSQSTTDLHKNGTDDSAAKDAIKDNNDLVSILAGSDKPDDNISSSINVSVNAAAKSNNNSNAVTAATATAATVIENKLLKENVSTISEPGVNEATDTGVGGKAAKQEIISSHSSTTPEKSSSNLSATVSGSETSSDSLANFAKAVEKINGLSDETDTSIDKPVNSTKSSVKDTPKGAASSKTAADSSSIKSTTTPQTPVAKVSTPEPSVFDINICYESNSELIYFSVERQDANKTASSAAEKSTSSGAGSVTSNAEPFVLPSRAVSTIASDSSTLSSLASASTTEAVPQLEKSRQEVKGSLELCDFIINHFEKLRSKLVGEKATPTTTGRRGKSAANAEPSTPASASAGSKRKRGAATATQESPSTTDDSELQPKSAKKAKKEPATPKTPATSTVTAAAGIPTESDYPEKAVLARWVDKKFYAGRVVDQKPNNKFVVLFEDGAKKTLPEEHIVFGKDNILPLANENVHALVSEETYEPGTVESVETKDDGTYYTVKCESTTVTVTASDIYLEEDQAKVIIAKLTKNNPEPGFSGGLSTRKDRRNKRAESNRQVQSWFSESDVSDINESDSRPTSPVTVLEAVDGVQPELQHTSKESELVRVCWLMERFGNDFKKVNLDSVLGPIVQSNILKNKSFLLTCTIPIKATTNGTHNERQNIRSNGFDLNNKSTTFSTVPFFKDHLKQQIEAAGGIVYSNFENVPTNKYRSCFLLAPFPCITAKYVQCLAANITAVSHEWIVESCQYNRLLIKDDYVLPSGWSIVENKYKPWSIGRGREQRKNAFNKTTIILTSQQNDFVEFWSRVCKSAGAKIRLVKSTNDLTATTKGYILLDDEFPQEYQYRAERFHIPIVSTVWVIQSLILGKVCDPSAHPKLTQLYEDDYF